MVNGDANNEIQMAASNRCVPVDLTTPPQLYAHPKQTGILVVGHGSRRSEANADVREAARRIGDRGGFRLIEAAFLEIEHPNVAEGFVRLIEQGASEIIVHPYFLSPGRHTRGDLPRQVNEVATQYPLVQYRITEPLSAHPLVIEAAIDRIRDVDGAGVSVGVGERAKLGKVYLVGAGPGEPALLTLRARELLRLCDVVFYDGLVDPEVLQWAPARAELIDVRKVGRCRCTSQDEINRKLIQQAEMGKRVMRLKGGDPFLFGRGGEEAEALYKAAIPFEVVPGVSSALAVPAYAGIPLTHRDYSSSVAILTGARAGDGDCNNQSLNDVAHADTIVILMGVAHLREITTSLIRAGRDRETPTAVIRWGTYDSQQTVIGTLESIPDDVERAALCAPAVIVVGEVVRLRARLNWFEESLADVRGKAVFAAA